MNSVRTMHGIALHSVIPVRAEAREQAEQTTQMLFAEVCTIEENKIGNKGFSADERVEKNGFSMEVNSGKMVENGEENCRWNRVKLQSDGQAGWVDKKMITPMSAQEYEAHTKALESAAMVAMPMAYAVSENNGQTIPLTAGTRLPHYANGTFEVLGVRFRIDPGMVIEKPLELTQANLLQATRFFLNVPYLWGGKNALGMDCSGFTQTIYSLFGKHLHRDASAQVRQGRAIAGLKTAKPGDLVFFCHYHEPKESTVTEQELTFSELETTSAKKESTATEQERVTHVGILLDQERVLHCSGRVKVERIDDKGICSMELADKAHPTGVYTHKLLAIKRV